MKNLISIVVLITLIIDCSFATVRTLSNYPAGGAQYTNLQAVYDASANGDSIIIEGTDSPYFLNCGVYWDKSLTVIGIGFNPNKQNPRKTKIRITDCLSNHFQLSNASSGSRFYGIEFTGRVAYGSPVDNVLFENCKFNEYISFGGYTSTNNAFRNCVFDLDNDINVHMGYNNNAQSSVFQNCIFDGSINGNGANQLNVLIDHCLFLTSGTTYHNLYYATYRNNIFMNAYPSGSFFGTWINNLCRIAGTFPPAPANGNTGSGNIENTDPLFVNSPANDLYSTLRDYHLQAGSAAIGTADDATDIGVHGGFTSFSEQGEVLINPIIRSLNILNTSVAPNGILNVQIHATNPDID